MIRIICTECKNAYLQNKGDKLICPSCEATYSKDMENLLLGIQYYNEENYSEADNSLMKYIVKNGADSLALLYKAFCDAREFDEDTTSLDDTYQKILNVFADVADEDYPKFIALANDETEKIEKALAESHIRLFADADAEKIKKEVATILNIQKEARDFRAKLNDLVIAFNERSDRKISAKFSECFFVESGIAAEVGDIKHQKICESIASHTVFTGILTNDIKNLEIYFRCIVMFFQKSHDKYEFLLAQSAKFTELAEILEKGQYNTIKGIGAISDKLKSVSYEFLEESYKEHFDEQLNTQTETVVVIEPEIVEEPEVIEVLEVAEENEESVSEEVLEAAEETEESISEEVIEAAEKAEETISEDVAEVAEEAEESISEDVLEAAEEAEETISEDVAEAAEKAEEIVSDDAVEIAEDSDIIEITINDNDAQPDEAEEVVEIEDISSASEIDEQPESDNIDKEATEETVSEEIQEETAKASSQYEVIEVDLEETKDEEIITEEVILEADEEPVTRKQKKKKSGKGAVLLVLIIVLVGILAGFKYIPGYINDYKYTKATALADEGNYKEAVSAFRELGEYSDSSEKADECEYQYALKLEKEGKFADAKSVFSELGNYQDSKTKMQSCAYNEAKQALENGDFDTALNIFTELGEYGDSEDMINECSYRNAVKLMEAKEYKKAIKAFSDIENYSDSKEKISEAKYLYVTENFSKKDKTTVKYLNELTSAKYRNCADLRKELLGSAEVLSTEIKAFVNYSSTDLETSLTELENTQTIYFHVIVEDESLYGQTLTLKYTTAFGYSQKKTVTLSEGDNAAYMSYPPTQHKNYTVEFELLNPAGEKVSGQTITF